MTLEPSTELMSRDQIEIESKGGITRRWLELAAYRGDGPPFIKISRRCVRYRRSDYEAWLAARTVSNSDDGDRDV